MKNDKIAPQESAAFWDCDCPTNYIQPRRVSRCKVCKVNRADAGPSDSIEVEAMQKNIAPDGDYKAVRHQVNGFLADEIADLQWILETESREMGDDL